MLYPLSYEGQLRTAAILPDTERSSYGDERAVGSSRDPIVVPAADAGQARDQGVVCVRPTRTSSSRLRAGTTMTGQEAWDRTP